MTLFMSAPLRRGFTLIELLIVIVILGILAAAALTKVSATKLRAARAAGVADLHNLAMGQEGFFVDSNRYASLADTGNGAGKLNFAPTPGHTGLAITVVPSGWNASLVVSGNQTCGIYYGLAARPTGMPATTQTGVPVCW
jgi:prepilin-type N-terminal cleavage/methylation domain-containing protein